MPASPPVPSYDAFMLPIVERLKAHGRSMTNDEMVDDVAAHMGLSDEVRAVAHGVTGQTEVEYRMAWARTYLKKIGAVENSARGVWRLTSSGARLSDAEIGAGPRKVRQDYFAGRQSAAADPTPVATEAATPSGADQPDDWKGQLLAALLQMDPAAFERLCQRLLRESGFTKVEVTGRSGDGGIDGVGVLRVNLLSFHVLFQSKRWKGSLGAGVVRDFRGAMVGRSDKGLIITTGTFTPDARREATRDGAPAIDLVDGEALCGLLRDLGLGVTVRMEPVVSVDAAALADI